MKRQGGFTLIELVVVIVILGILAVTAAPRFLNLQGDARQASLEGLRGAMQGAAGIVYGRAAIDGVENQADGAISAGDDTIDLVWGYPEASATGIVLAVDGLGTADWAVSASGSVLQATFGGDNPDYGCSVTYNNAAEGATPVITVSDADDC